MIFLDLPTGDGYGWGVCGDALARAIAAAAPAGEEVVRLGDGDLGMGELLPGPLLQAVRGADLQPIRPLRARRKVGYAFFEEDAVAQRAVAAGAELEWDALAVGSRWCASALAEAGYARAVVVHQGIDPGHFHPRAGKASEQVGSFVVFSGGKLELRKGQDLVVEAFRRFARRHPEARLVAAWLNPWPASAATMVRSPVRPFAWGEGETFAEATARWLAAAGLGPERATLLPSLPHAACAEVYRGCTVGLFPNRCEGGTNLVLMEAMACGLPAIAAGSTGQADVVTQDNALPLSKLRPLVVERGGEVVAHWTEPDVDEIVDRLEQAHADRELLGRLGRRAAADLAGWTWERTGRRFLELLKEPGSRPAAGS